MVARSDIKLLAMGVNLQFLLFILDSYPIFISDPFLSTLVLFDLLVIITPHYADILLIVSIESPVFMSIWNVLSKIGDQQLMSYFLFGVIVHIVILKTKIMSNFL